MQSSNLPRPRKGRTTRVAGVGAAVGLTLLVTGSWIACSPGDVDCDKVMCGPSTGGTPPPAECDALSVKTTADFATKFIGPKCGTAMCHASVFPPRNLNGGAQKVKDALVGKNAATLCKTDFYINKDEPMNSYVLAKVTADGDNLACPSGGDAKSGGTRMPNMAPTIPGPKLSAEELSCFTWWVKELAAGR